SRRAAVSLHDALPIYEEAARVLGILAVRDEPRPDAERGVERLKAMGVHPVMLTGDHERAAGAIAGGLGMEYQAALLPADKLRVIGELKAKDRKSTRLNSSHVK